MLSNALRQIWSIVETMYECPNLISSRQAHKPMNIFERIRNGFGFVAERADHVRINEIALKEFTLSLPNAMPENVFDDQHHFIGDAEQTAAYVLTLDAMNFGSGFEPELVAEGWERIDDSLYFTIATHLKSHFEMHGIINSDSMQLIGINDIIDMLKLNKDGAYSFEFARLIAMSLRDLGQMISDECEGSFYQFIQSMNRSASACVERLAKLKSFRDVHPYKDCQVFILKRAQCVAADMHDAFMHINNTPLFDDIDQLTILPDNDIPHVLRMEGVLEYSEELSQMIESGTPLASGSPYEIELRCVAAHAVELMADIKAMPVIHLDRIIWHKCWEDPKYKTQEPHRTQSSFY